MIKENLIYENIDNSINLIEKFPNAVTSVYCTYTLDSILRQTSKILKWYPRVEYLLLDCRDIEKHDLDNPIEWPEKTYIKTIGVFEDNSYRECSDNPALDFDELNQILKPSIWKFMGEVASPLRLIPHSCIGRSTFPGVTHDFTIIVEPNVFLFDMDLWAGFIKRQLAANARYNIIMGDSFESRLKHLMKNDQFRATVQLWYPD